MYNRAPDDPPNTQETLFFFWRGPARTLLETAIWWTSRNCPTLAFQQSGIRWYEPEFYLASNGRGPTFARFRNHSRAVRDPLPLRSRLRVGGDGLTPGCGPRGGGGPGGAPGLHPGPAVQGQSLAAPRAGPGPPGAGPAPVGARPPNRADFTRQPRHELRPCTASVDHRTNVRPRGYPERVLGSASVDFLLTSPGPFVLPLARCLSRVLS